MLTTSGFTVALYKAPDGTLCMFDSHCRGTDGKPDSEGTAVMMSFSSVEELGRHVEDVYKIDEGRNMYTITGVSLLKTNVSQNKCKRWMVLHPPKLHKSKRNHSSVAKTFLCSLKSGLVYTFHVCFC